MAWGHYVGTDPWGCAVREARQESRRRVRWGFAVTEDRQNAPRRVRTRRRECRSRHRRPDDPDGSTPARTAHRVALLDWDRLKWRSSPLPRPHLGGARRSSGSGTRAAVFVRVAARVRRTRLPQADPASGVIPEHWPTRLPSVLTVRSGRETVFRAGCGRTSAVRSRRKEQPWRSWS